jgi:NADPH:quinone reductase-like Zn-dependent oxidoreductase
MIWVKRILGGIGVLLLVAIAAFAVVMSHDSPCSPLQPADSGPSSMRAIVHRCYGGPDVARLENIPKPPPPDDRVLVKVHAASVNPLDWHYVRGKPYVMRPGVGFGKPTDIRLGTDFAGTVEAVGKNVTRWKVGDEVFGGADGAFAEYVNVRENGAIALKPANVTFEQAASVPIAATTALQALRDEGQLKPGQKVLINGASGGVGTFAVQIAKSMGAVVTGVCSTRNVAMVQSLGADHAIDYTKDDFTKGSEHYDLILDTVGNHSLSELRHVLTPEGAAVLIGGPSTGDWLGPLSQSLVAWVESPFHHNKVGFMLADLTGADLAKLGDLMQAGKLTPVIDRTYKLADTFEAIRYVEAGHSRGKVIIDVD